MLSLQLLVVVLPTIILASSDDWLLDLVAKRDSIPYSPSDHLTLESRQVNNTRRRYGKPRKFVMFLNFICFKLKKLENQSADKETLLRNTLSTFKVFKDSLEKTCDEYKAFRKELVEKIKSMRTSTPPPPTSPTPSPPTPSRRDLDERFIRELLKLL